MRSAAAAIVAAFMAMVMLMTVGVEMIMLVGMGMAVVVGMFMGMGMGNAVVGVLMGMGVVMLVAVIAGADMIVIQMHRITLLRDFFFIIPVEAIEVKTFIFPGISPCGACATCQNRV